MADLLMMPPGRLGGVVLALRHGQRRSSSAGLAVLAGQDGALAGPYIGVVGIARLTFFSHVRPVWLSVIVPLALSTKRAAQQSLVSKAQQLPHFSVPPARNPG